MLFELCRNCFDWPGGETAPSGEDTTQNTTAAGAYTTSTCQWVSHVMNNHSEMSFSRN